jgi:hypothetical protein
MEPSGRNAWQPVANGGNAKTAQTGENRSHRLPIGAHGKEGVAGSSPAETLAGRRPLDVHLQACQTHPTPRLTEPETLPLS